MARPLAEAPGYAVVELAGDLDRVPPGLRLVAATPEAVVECALRGFEAESLEDALDPVEVEELGANWFEVIGALCSRLDELAGDEPPRTPGRWHFYRLKVLHDGARVRSLAISRWLDRTEPTSVLSFATGSSWDRALVCELAARGVVHERRPSTPGSRLLTALPLRTRVLRTLRRLTAPRRPRVLAVDYDYSIPFVARELRRLGRPVALLELPGPSSSPRTDTWLAVQEDEQARGAFVWDGVDHWSAVCDELRQVVETECAAAAARFDAADERFRRIRPDALLLSMGAQGSERAVCAAATSLGIPVIVSRHGEMGMRRVPMVAHQELAEVSHELCWGRWEADWIRGHVDRAVDARVVGSPYGELAANAPSRKRARRRLGIASEEKTVLYLPQLLDGEHWYLSRRAPTDSVHLRQQLLVLHALAAQTRFRPLVKEHPAVPEPSLLARWAEHELPGRIRFLYGRTFAQLVQLADAVVIDYPSTALVQALFGSARIIVTDDPISVWEPGVREHLEANGVAFVPPGELVAGLETLDLRHGGYSRAVREPLLASGSGSAAERVARAVVAIVSESASTTP